MTAKPKERITAIMEKISSKKKWKEVESKLLYPDGGWSTEELYEYSGECVEETIRQIITHQKKVQENDLGDFMVSVSELDRMLGEGRE